MTAKEKAQSRSYYYWLILGPVIKDEYIRGVTAVKCAISEVEEIIKALTEYGDESMELQNMDRELNWRNEVLAELKLME